MSKIIKNGFEAKQAIKAGVDKAANVIKVTLGPTGKAVILDKSYGSPTITDDGVTVAKEVELEDRLTVFQIYEPAQSLTKEVSASSPVGLNELSEVDLEEMLKNNLNEN